MVTSSAAGLPARTEYTWAVPRGRDGQDPRSRSTTSSGIGRAWSCSPADLGRPTHARTSKPAEQSRAPTEISCSMRKVFVRTQATFDRIDVFWDSFDWKANRFPAGGAVPGR